jgi:hypothetical protein
LAFKAIITFLRRARSAFEIFFGTPFARFANLIAKSVGVIRLGIERWRDALVGWN